MSDHTTPHRADIILVGVVTTAEDGFSPVVEGWGFDNYDGPMVDRDRRTVCGWPIHELAAMAAWNARRAT